MTDGPNQQPPSADKADENQGSPAIVAPATSPITRPTDSTDNTEPGALKKPGGGSGRWSTVVVTAASGIFALVGAFIGAGSSYLINNQNIKAQHDQQVEQFKRDQKRDAYADILKQATNLHNVSLSTGLGLLFNPALAGTAPDASKGPPEPTIITGPDIRPAPDVDANNPRDHILSQITPNDRNIFSATAPERKQWQDAYNALDSSIANARLFSDPDVIGDAMALRDKYSIEFSDSIDGLTGLKDLVKDLGTATSSTPGEVPYPDKDKPVGPPLPHPPYDPNLLNDSTAQLTDLYVTAASNDINNPK